MVLVLPTFTKYFRSTDSFSFGVGDDARARSLRASGGGR